MENTDTIKLSKLQASGINCILPDGQMGVTVDGKELFLKASEKVRQQVQAYRYTHDKSRSYTLELTGEEITGILPGDQGRMHGLRLADLDYQQEPPDALVFRRDKVVGGYTTFRCLKSPLGVPLSQFEASLETLPALEVGDQVHLGYMLLRVVTQTPGTEIYILSRSL